MKLLLVSHYMPPHQGGIERLVEDQAGVAHAAGWDVTWIASRAPAAAAPVATEPWGRALRVSCWNPLEATLHVPYPIWSPAARQVVSDAVLTADLVHVHGLLYPGTSLALAAAAHAGKPALLSEHVGFVPYASPSLRLVQRVALRTIGRRNLLRADAWSYVNGRVCGELEELCFPARRPAHYLPTGIDTERFRPVRDAAERRMLRARHGLPQDAVVVLFVGRLVEKKGVDLVLQAAGAGYHTLLIGDGVLAAIPAGVELRPFISRAALAEILRCADILVLPSHGEGLPIVALEAMASGLAVVLGDDPIYAGLLSAGSALLVPRAVPALRAVLARLAAAPAERADLGRRARAMICERWAEPICGAQLLQTYAALVRASA